MSSFEDRLGKIQNELIQIAYEYSEKNQVDKIFIYCSLENSAYYFNVFYESNGKVLEKHELNPVILKQKNISKKGKSKLLEFEKLFEENSKEMFKELKLVYDLKTKKSKAEFDYELKYSNSETLLPSDIFRKWLESIQK